MTSRLVHVGQTWCYDGDPGEPGNLYLVLDIRPNGVLTEDRDTVLVNLETGEVHEAYPLSHMTRGNSFWKRVT